MDTCTGREGQPGGVRPVTPTWVTILCGPLFISSPDYQAEKAASRTRSQVSWFLALKPPPLPLHQYFLSCCHPVKKEGFHYPVIICFQDNPSSGATLSGLDWSWENPLMFSTRSSPHTKNGFFLTALSYFTLLPLPNFPDFLLRVASVMSWSKFLKCPGGGGACCSCSPTSSWSRLQSAFLPPPPSRVLPQGYPSGCSLTMFFKPDSFILFLHQRRSYPRWCAFGIDFPRRLRCLSAVATAEGLLSLSFHHIRGRDSSKVPYFPC